MTRTGESSLFTTGRPQAEKLSEQVARAILADIVERQLPPGTMLPPEPQMLKHFEVGRATLREALRILEAYGLVRLRQGAGGGPVVTAVESRNFGKTATFYFHARRSRFEHLLQARLILEPVMARMAAENPNQLGKRRITENLRAAEESMDDTGSTWSRLASDFHGLISGCTGNPVLDLLGSSLNDIHTERAKPIFPIDQRGSVLRVHQKIGDAIVSGDAARAERLARRHIEEMAERLKGLDPALMSEMISWH